MTLGFFAPRALSELEGAAEWIAAENPQAARALVTCALSAAELLAALPKIGRQRRGLLPDQ